MTGATAAGRYVCSGTLEGGAIRYTYAGTTAPTATTGHPLAVNKTITISGLRQLKNFRAIRTTGTDGTIFFTCSR